MTSPVVRPATAEDVPGIIAVLAANDEDPTWPDGPGAPYLDHVLGHGIARVATVGGRVVGFAGAVTTASGTHLSDLFVDPAAQGRGIGRTLIGAILPATGPRTVSSSAAPSALALYARTGLRLSWPLLYLAGPSEAIAAGAIAAGASDVVVDRVAAPELDAVEAELAGEPRSALHAYQAALPDAYLLVATRRGAPVAAGAARRMLRGTGVWLERLVLADADRLSDGDRPGVIAAVLRAVARPGRAVGLCVPGPHPALPGLLDAGVRIVDRDTFCESEPGLVDPRRSLVDPSFL